MDKNSNFEIKKIPTDELIGKLNNIEKKFSPPYLFIKGNYDIMNTRPRISIIGTRKPSESGIHNTRKLTEFLVNKGIVIVSGLASGIDSIAHKTAISNGGKTIAVLGTPIDKYYPIENKLLQDEIAINHLLISQFPVGYPIQQKNFPMRNRTMALLSHASIIVEAGERSGTIHQGWEALRLGRPLFIIEDMVKNKNITWVSKLMDYGAEILPISKLKMTFESLPIPTPLGEEYVTL